MYELDRQVSNRIFFAAAELSNIEMLAIRSVFNERGMFLPVNAGLDGVKPFTPVIDRMSILRELESGRIDTAGAVQRLKSCV